MSKLITIPATGAPTAEDAKLSDIATTLLSTDKAVVGTYGFLQKVMLVGVGMVAQNYRNGNGLNIFR
jgi:hypothetical protein